MTGSWGGDKTITSLSSSRTNSVLNNAFTIARIQPHAVSQEALGNHDRRVSSAQMAKLILPRTLSIRTKRIKLIPANQVRPSLNHFHEDLPQGLSQGWSESEQLYPIDVLEILWKVDYCSWRKISVLSIPRKKWVTLSRAAGWLSLPLPSLSKLLQSLSETSCDCNLWYYCWLFHWLCLLEANK